MIFKFVFVFQILSFHATNVDSLALSPNKSAINERQFASKSSRRSFIAKYVLTGITTSILYPTIVTAQDGDAPPPPTRNRNGKPFAPSSALLPATRLKLWIDGAHDASTALRTARTTANRYDALEGLNQILTNPPRLFLPSDKAASGTTTTLAATSQLTTPVSSGNKSQYRENRMNLSIGGKISAALNQADVERQWGMLRYQQSKMEKNDQLRAAFNFYTSQLTFTSEGYELTASREDKKRLIREEGGLPSVTTVITSDLDLRDLYRNQFLTGVEDLRAEVGYQLKRGEEDLDMSDVVELMEQVYGACRDWFGLIDPGDVREALNIVMNEDS